MATPTFIHYGARSVLFDPVANECGRESNWESLPDFIAREATSARQAFLYHVIREGCDQSKVWAAHSECLTAEDVQLLLQPDQPKQVRWALNGNPVALALRSIDDLIDLIGGKANRLRLLQHCIGQSNMPLRKKHDLISRLLESCKGTSDPYAYVVPFATYEQRSEQSVEAPGIWLSIGESVFPLNTRYIAELDTRLINELGAWDYVLSIDSTRLKRQLLDRHELPTFVVDRLRNDKAYSVRIRAATHDWDRGSPAEARILLGGSQHIAYSVGGTESIANVILKNQSESLEIEPILFIEKYFKFLLSVACGLKASESAARLLAMWANSELPLLRQAAAVSSVLPKHLIMKLAKDSCEGVRFMLVQNPTALLHLSEDDLGDLIGNDPDLAFCAATVLRDYELSTDATTHRLKQERIGRLEKIVAADPGCEKKIWLRRIKLPEAGAATLEAQIGSDIDVTVRLNTFLRNDKRIADEFPLECLPPTLYKLACNASLRNKTVRCGSRYVRHEIARRPELLKLLSREELNCLLAGSPYTLLLALKTKETLPTATQSMIEELASHCPDPSVRMAAAGRQYSEEIVGKLRLGELTAGIAFKDARAILKTVLANPSPKQLPIVESLVRRLIASRNRLERKLAVRFSFLSREQVRGLLVEDDDEIVREVLHEGRNLNGCSFEELLVCVEGNAVSIAELVRAYRNGYRIAGEEEVPRLVEFCNRSGDRHLRDVAAWLHPCRDKELLMRFSIPDSPLDGRLVLEYLGHCIPLRPTDVYPWVSYEKVPLVPEPIKAILEEVERAGS